MTPEHALDRTARLIGMDLFAGQVPASQITDGLQATTVQVRADEANLSSPSGQTALCTLFGQIAMMGIGISLDIPDVPLLAPQPPLRGTRLRTALLNYGGNLIPGNRCGIGLRETDLAFTLGDTRGADLHAVRVTGGDWCCATGPVGQVPPRRWHGTWPVGAMLAAAAAAPEALRAAVTRIASATGTRPTREFRTSPGLPASIDLSGRAVPARPLDLGHVDVISGGAITNATLYALLRVPGLSGLLRVIEPDILDVTNLNRYPLARLSDVGRAKAAILKGYSHDGLLIRGVEGFFDNSWPSLLVTLAPRMLIGADQIPARWAAQRAAPSWLQVSGTSHFLVMSSSHHPDGPCAGCAHPRDEQGSDPIPTISFVSLWAGILQAVDLLNEADGQTSAGSYTVCSPFGLSGTRPLITRQLAPAPGCPVPCRAARSQPLLAHTFATRHAPERIQHDQDHQTDHRLNGEPFGEPSSPGAGRRETAPSHTRVPLTCYPAM
jgi:hypothetical protein